MSANDALTLVAAAAQLALALLAAAYAASGPLPRALAWVCLDVFAWNAAELAEAWTGHAAWDVVDHAAASLTMPLVLELVLVFVGERARFRAARAVAWAYCGGIALLCVAGAWVPAVGGFARSEAWALAVLIGALAGSALALARLWAHHRRTREPLERRRGVGVLIAILVGASFSLTELFANLDLPVTRLSHVGTLVSTLLLAQVALRGRLISAHRAAASLSLAAALCIIGGYVLMVSQKAAEDTLLLSFLAVLATVLTVTALLPAIVFRLAHQRRQDDLAFAGRMSAQLAHDLKNPLTAVRGAADFLIGELDAGRSVDGRRDMLELVRSESLRLGRLADSYLRLARVEPVRTPFMSDALVDPVLDALVPGGVAVVRPAAVVALDGDLDLLEVALENVVRNAVEATPAGGTIAVVAVLREGRAQVTVRDSGRGMDPRTRERAGEPFFTTKASGSGLGLGIARRIVEAHGGRLELASALGEGTTVSMTWPVEGSR